MEMIIHSESNANIVIFRYYVHLNHHKISTFDYVINVVKL